MQVLFILCLVSCDTRLFALWSWSNGATRLILSCCMMITWGKSIRFAPIRCVIEPPGWNSTVLKMSPSSVWPASITSHTTIDSTATDQIFGWDSGLLFLSTGNTNTIAHGFNSSKGPAWAACTLISNLFDRLTVWPLNSWIKVLWEAWKRSDFFDRQFEMLWSLKGAHKANDIFFGPCLKIGVFTSFPWNSWSRVYEID